jgi:hypothetical protein
VLQCTENEPIVCKDLVRVPLTTDGINKFAHQFHTEEGFYLGDGIAFKLELDNNTIQRRSTRLYDELRNVVPISGRKDLFRWDFFTLQLSNDSVKQLKGRTTGEASEIDLKIIEDDSVVVKTFGEAIKHFGFQTFVKDTKFADLVRQWKEALPKKPAVWVNELKTEMWRAIRNRPSKPGLVFMQSARSNTDWRLCPIVNHARVLPDQRMEFDIYLYNFPEQRLGIAPAQGSADLQKVEQEVESS